MGRLLQGDLGTSYFTGKPVLNSTLDRLPETALLASAGAIVMLALGLPLGLIAALRRRTIVDRGILVFSLLGVVVPTFVLGFLLLYFLAFKLDAFPLGGSGSLHAPRAARRSRSESGRCLVYAHAALDGAEHQLRGLRAQRSS